MTNISHGAKTQLCFIFGLEATPEAPLPPHSGSRLGGGDCEFYGRGALPRRDEFTRASCQHQGAFTASAGDSLPIVLRHDVHTKSDGTTCFCTLLSSRRASCLFRRRNEKLVLY
jgi:hypothetical protein